MDIEKKLTAYLEDAIAKDKNLLLNCTGDELLNIQTRVKCSQGLLNMISNAVKKPESEISFD